MVLVVVLALAVAAAIAPLAVILVGLPALVARHVATSHQRGRS
jgi:hypothetical protein